MLRRSETRISWLPFVTAGLALCLAHAAAAWGADKDRFSDETTVVVVEVPVQVTREGEPVRGLTVDDFEVFDGKKRQDILDFEVIDLSLVAPGAGPGEVLQMPAAGRRHFLFLFDLSFSDPATIVRAREAAIDLVESGLHPADVAAVATYSISRGSQLVLGFTSDRRQVRVAIETLGLANPIHASPDPLGLMIADLEAGSGAGSGGAAAPGGGASPAATFLENLRDMSALSGRAVRDQRKNDILAMSSSLTDLAGMMQAAPGRKHVVFLSEGFDSSILLGNQGTSSADRERIEEMNRNAAQGEFWKVDSDERYGSTSTQSGLQEMLAGFVRADCAIQAVDIAGLRAGVEADAQSRRQDGLFLMANETGGELYRNYNNLTEAMGQMLESTSVTYLLSFQPRDLEQDGKYHKLKIKVNDLPRGARLVHRPGYFAPVPYEAQAPLQRRLEAAGRVMGAGEDGDFETAVLAASFVADGDRAYVPVLIEIDGPSLLAAQSGENLPTEIYAYAIAADGEIHDSFTQLLALDMGRVGENLRQGGFKFFGHFDLPPGEYVVRSLVRNGANGASSVSTVPLFVPDLDGPVEALLPPLFPEPPGRWLMGQEQGASEQAVYPFQVQGQPFIPAAEPVIRIGVETAVCLMGFRLAPAGDMEVEARVLARDGSPVEAAAEILADGAPSREANGAEAVRATLRLEGLAPGSYTLEISARLAGGEVQSSSIPIKVTS